MHHHMSLVEEIRQSWGWVGIEPVEVVGENDFGNLIVKDEDENIGACALKIATARSLPTIAPSLTHFQPTKISFWTGIWLHLSLRQTTSAVP